MGNLVAKVHGLRELLNIFERLTNYPHWSGRNGPCRASLLLFGSFCASNSQ